MKLNCWLILGAMLSTSVLAQQDTNPPPTPPIETPAAAPAITSAPAPASTNALPAKAGKKKSANKKKSNHKKAAKPAPKPSEAAELKTTPLVPGPATVVGTHVNVRGQGKLKSEIVARLTKGDQVTVIQEIVHNNSGPTEPSAWAKIALPASAKAWVSSAYLTNNSARAKLKVRSGPGENYSMVGMLQSGDEVKPLGTKGDWTQIEPPANAYAFVAAQYLKQEEPGAIAAAPTTPTTPEPAPTTTTVVPTEEVVSAATNVPTPPPTETLATSNAPTVASVTDTNVSEVDTNVPPPPRIVAHEGIVRGMTSIQAPSHFELYSPETGQTIDYLYTTSTNLDLRRWKGLRVVATGEEGLDERWGNTPVLTLQRIQLVDERPSP